MLLILKTFLVVHIKSHVSSSNVIKQKKLTMHVSMQHYDI